MTSTDTFTAPQPQSATTVLVPQPQHTPAVWSTIVGQRPTVELLSRTAATTAAIAQSWLICGPAGSGRSNVARAFAAALECPNHGCGECSTCRHILAGTHPDVTVLATDKVTIGIDEVRGIIEKSEQMPSTTPWRIIIIEDVDRMLERTTNVLLKEIEEPAAHTIWLLCAPSAQDVLPTIRSRTRVVNLAIPSDRAVAEFLMTSVNPTLPDDKRFTEHVAARAARLAEGHIGIARLYATNERVMTDRDTLVVGVLNLTKASDAVLLADHLISDAKAQAEAEIDAQTAREQADFRRVNGLGEKDRIPPKIRGAYNAIGKKEDVRRRVTRRSRDVLDRGLNSIASVYRDVAVLQNDAEGSVGIVNKENRTAIAELASRLSRQPAIERLEYVAEARRRLAGNGNPLLVFEALFCALIVS
ncbi:DNA polymerase III subunit delta' [Bifidobacterium tissieri]|uniref:DNA polymerase III subunit delta n=1 Tax=Bifidobacterium tissieri TaxID=1630162 RepID=A0A5M9ZR68_9BIFI|nr:DNA polymerase III subunit delta' [Bifidobacterium tissieri]KAA8829939.1 DNA polymerase III subunit delta' [Bifidobacterium tissieri]